MEGTKRDKQGPSFPFSVWNKEPKGQPIKGRKEKFLLPIFKVLQIMKNSVSIYLWSNHRQKIRKSKWTSNGMRTHEPDVRRAKTRRSPSLMSSKTLQPSHVTLEFCVKSDWRLFWDIIDDYEDRENIKQKTTTKIKIGRHSNAGKLGFLQQRTEVTDTWAKPKTPRSEGLTVGTTTTLDSKLFQRAAGHGPGPGLGRTGIKIISNQFQSA